MGDDGRDAVVVDVVRTTLGKRKGALATWHPVDLLGFALTSLVERTGVDPEQVDDVIGGCVTQVGEQSTNVTRNAWVAAGLPQQVPATTVDRQCGSSQQAMHFAAAGVVAGHYDLVVACGVESMSRVPLASNARGGTGPFPPSFLDEIDGRLWAQFRVAQVLADRWEISREDMDAFALESHRRAAAAWDEGRFAGEAVPVPLKDEDGRLDRAPASSPTRGSAAPAPWSRWPACRPAQSWEPDTAPDITAGNSSQMTDGASAMLIAERSVAERLGLPDPGPVRPRHRGRRRRRHRAVGAGAGHPATARPVGHDDRPVRRRRVQRGLRRHRADVAAGLPRRPGGPQPVRRGHRHRPPARGERGAAGRHPDQPPGGHRRPLRVPDHVRGRRAGQRHGDRAAGLTPPPGRPSKGGDHDGADAGGTRPGSCWPPGEGRVWPMGRLEAVFKADGAESAGRYSISEWWLEPHTAGPGPTRTPRTTSSTCSRGRSPSRWATTGSRRRGGVRAGAGRCAHDFANRTATRAGFLNISVPGDFEPNMPGISAWFRDRSDEDGRPGAG